MENYKLISVQDFVRLDSEKENKNQSRFELRGIPRSISINGTKNCYQIDFYLQEGNYLIPVYLGGEDVYANLNLELLKACGESNIEIIVYGYCEPSIYFPRLRVGIVNVLGRNLLL